ncbi:hypothetical protein GGI07_004640 [Coemansia sp. Benny D115]|nr:hypothetical protein GGI07_004640 [Coemansia sp. Benny D115]
MSYASDNPRESLGGSFEDLTNGGFDPMTEELPGFDHDVDDVTDNLGPGETMSHIGRVVSQAETGVDFEANIQGPLEGLQKRRHRRVSGYRTNSMGDLSRFQDGAWRDDRENAEDDDGGRNSAPMADLDFDNSSMFSHDELEPLDLTTHSAAVSGGEATYELPDHMAGHMSGRQSSASPSAAAGAVTASTNGSAAARPGVGGVAATRADNSEEQTTRDLFIDHAEPTRTASGRTQPEEHTMGSFQSDGYQPAAGGSSRPLPTRPGSSNPSIDNDNSFDHTPLANGRRRPTYSSLSPSPSINDPQTRTAANARLARLMARYAGHAGPADGPSGASDLSELKNAPSSENLTDAIRELQDTPDLNTAFTSAQFSARSESPPMDLAVLSAAQNDQNTRGLWAAEPSLVERTRHALQLGFGDAAYTTGQQQQEKQQQQQQPEQQQGRPRSPSTNGQATDAPYGEIRQRFLAGPSTFTTDQQPSAYSGAFPQATGYSIHSRSIESLDHPNMGSQGTASAGNSMISMMDSRDDRGLYSGVQDTVSGAGAAQFDPFDNNEDEDYGDDNASMRSPFGARMMGNFDDSSTKSRLRSPRPFESVRTGRETFGEFSAQQQLLHENSEEFTPIGDADELFGNYAASSNPDWSDIVRDHEQVFSDLILASEGDEEGDFDPNNPPDSLFASSGSIYAGLKRAAKHKGSRQIRNFSAWDGREATKETLRQQDEIYSSVAGGPFQLLQKTNSLGLSDHDSEISGLLPESEHSPRRQRSVDQRPGSPSRNAQNQNRPHPTRGRSNTGLLAGRSAANASGRQIGVLPGAYPGVPQTAPLRGQYGDRANGHKDTTPENAEDKSSSNARPPTTPTTFISRDTRHGPLDRVLHQVPPFDLASLQLPDRAASRQLDSKPGSTAAAAASVNGAGPQQPMIGLLRSRKPVGPRSISGSRRANQPPPLSIASSRNTTPDRRNAQAAAEFAQAASSDEYRVNHSGMASEDDTQGLGSLLQDTLPISESSRVSRTPNPSFQALNRILGTPRGSPGPSPLRLFGGPRSDWAMSPQQTSMLAGSSGNYMPFQEPTVDISRLPRFQDVRLQNPQGSESTSANATPQKAPLSPNGVSSAPNAGNNDVGSGQQYLVHRSQTQNGEAETNNGRFERLGERRMRRQTPTKYDFDADEEDDEMIGTVRYDSPTPSAGSLESLSMSDFGVESFSESHQRMSQKRVSTVGRRPSVRLRSGSHASAAQKGMKRSESEGGPTLKDIYDLLKKTASNMDSQSHSRTQSQSIAHAVTGLQDMVGALSRNQQGQPSFAAAAESGGAQATASHGPSFAYHESLRSHATNVTHAVSSIGNHVPAQLRSTNGASLGQQQQHYALDNAAGSMMVGEDGLLTAESHMSYPDTRPTAPTPRRSRLFPRFAENSVVAETVLEQAARHAADNVAAAKFAPAAAAAAANGQTDLQRVRSDTGHSRVRQYLQRYMSDSVAGNYGGQLHALMPHAEVTEDNVDGAVDGAVDGDGGNAQAGDNYLPEMVPMQQGRQRLQPAEILDNLVQILSPYGDLNKGSIPPPLAEKLMELVATLARASSSGRSPATNAATVAASNVAVGRATDSAVQTDGNPAVSSAVADDQLRMELLRLQRDILAKFDEYRSEVDMLRAEVRQGSTVASTAGNGASRDSDQQQQQKQQQNSGRTGSLSSIVPQDSVSVMAARRTAGLDGVQSPGGRGERLMTPSPRPLSDVRPMYAMPTTARNRQRQMVQWLSRQDADSQQQVKATDMSSDDLAAPVSPLVGRGKHRMVTTVEDIPEDDRGSVGGHSGGQSPRVLAKGNGYFDYDGDDVGYNEKEGAGADGYGEAADDDALSDTSTTVPDHLPRITRSPIDPAKINPAGVPSRRQLERMQNGGAGGNRRRISNPWGEHISGQQRDLLETREALDALRRHSSRKAQTQMEMKIAEHGGSGYESPGEMLYSREMARQLATTLAELQRVHQSHFHRMGTNAEAIACPVCAALEAQNQDPYVFGRHAVGYKSMSTRELQGLLNAYVKAMEDEFSRPRKGGSGGSGARGDTWASIEAARQLHAGLNGSSGGGRDRAGLVSSKPKDTMTGDSVHASALDSGRAAAFRHSFTPGRSFNGRTGGGRRGERGTAEAAGVATKAEADVQATQMVIGLLREELDALSRRYHRMVEEFDGLDPSDATDQRRRRQMARELKDLVDLLDVKGEQIAVLAGLHPSKETFVAEGHGGAGRSLGDKRLFHQQKQKQQYPPRRAFWDQGVDAAAGRGNKQQQQQQQQQSAISSTERAYQSAKQLQQALGELY